MERAYREDELVDSLVVDSEGYIYGRIGKIDIKEDEVSLLIYESRPDEKTVTNVQAIKEELLKRVKLNISAKFQKLSPNEILTENIRRELRLNADAPLTDQNFLEYAERTGVEITYKKAVEERREPKGHVRLNDLKAIGISTVGTKETSDVMKIILLREPREASFRKVPIQRTVPFRNTNTLKDKLVVDAKGLALGYLDSVVLFQNTPGIRIYSLKPSDSVSLSWLIKYLDSVGRPDIVEALVKYFRVETGEHVYRMTKSELEGFMQKTKLVFKVPDELMIDRSVKDFVMDIPWDMISKIGDIVILHKTLAELRSVGY
jgi:sporulation protein YlmC with PRC-barrel domain